MKRNPIDRQFKGILASGQSKFSARYQQRHEEAEGRTESRKIRERRPAPKDYITTPEQEKRRCQIISELKSL
jgi:hypothetical protein